MMMMMMIMMMMITILMTHYIYWTRVSELRLY